MRLISMRQLLDHAAERGYGVPAFNVNNMEQIKAIMGAAQKKEPRDSPGLRWRTQICRGAVPAPPPPRPLKLTLTFRSSCIRITVLHQMYAWARFAPALPL